MDGIIKNETDALSEDESMLGSEKNSENEDIIVFSTSKTLNERFTPKELRCVFIVNNGYTMPFKNNCIKDRIIIRNPSHVKIHKRFSSYMQGNLKEVKKVKGNGKQKQKESANKRRIVLSPTTFTSKPKISPSKKRKISAVRKNFDNSTPTNSGITDPKVDQVSGTSNSVTKTSKKGNRKQFCQDLLKSAANAYSKINGIYGGTGPITFSPFLYGARHYFNQSLFKWRRPPVSKEDLDNELDRYMSGVQFKEEPPVNQAADPFVQEYIMESEKFLNDEDSELSLMVE